MGCHTRLNPLHKPAFQTVWSQFQGANADPTVHMFDSSKFPIERESTYMY